MVSLEKAIQWISWYKLLYVRTPSCTLVTFFKILIRQKLWSEKNTELLKVSILDLKIFLHTMTQIDILCVLSVLRWLDSVCLLTKPTLEWNFRLCFLKQTLRLYLPFKLPYHHMKVSLTDMVFIESAAAI